MDKNMASLRSLSLRSAFVRSQISMKATNGILAKKETGRLVREQQNRIRRFVVCKSTERDKVRRLQQFRREH